MSSETANVLTAEIADLKKTRRSLEKNAYKAIRSIMNSSEEPKKKLEERRKVKKEMKAARVSTKQTLKEKVKALAAEKK
jgi:hypothetical protein